MKKYLLSNFVLFTTILNLNAQVGLNDATFNPGTGANNTIVSCALQSDSKIIIGGGFTNYNGTTINRIARVNSTGSLDGTFSVGAGANNTIYKVGVLSDSKILITGQFTSYRGVAKNRLVKINTDGTIATAFTIGAGANGFVYSFIEQPDGKIIIGGGFSSYAGVARKGIVRINANGTLDATFNPGTGLNNAVYGFGLQSDGKVLVGGKFTLANGASKPCLVRFNTNGTVDSGFSIGTGASGSGTNTAVFACAVQPDGKIIVGGVFSTFNGVAKNNIVRLNSNGTIDNTFISTGSNNTISEIKLQSDGKIVVVGSFTSFNSVTKNRITRLNSNGTNDNTFNGTGASSSILSSAIQTDGNIIIGGYFTSYSGDARVRIARVNSICATPTLSASQINNLCNGGSAASATISATGGTSFTYSWIPAGGTFSVATGLSAGTYSCVVTNECLNTSTIAVTIIDPSSISVVTGSSSTICLGSNSTITAIASGGSSGSYTYNWMPGNLSGASQTVSPNSNTIYTVTATDGNGCTGSNTQNVSVSPLPVISISGGTNTTCSGSTSTLTASGASSYIWSTGSNSATVLVSPLSTTMYSVTGTDVNGCSNSATKTVTVSGSCATTAVPCGITISNLSSTANAGNVTGAINYRFKFYNNITNALIATKTQASPTFTFNTVGALCYGNTYKWTVAVDKGSGFGSESNSNCTVTFAIPKTTVPCGYSYSTLSAYSTCVGIFGASNYRFSFYNNTTNALVAVKTQTSNYIYFNTVSGLVYDNTYKWTVEVEYNNGSSIQFGPASSNTCTITFNPPQTTVPCGYSYSTLSAYSTCVGIFGASNYRFSFYNNITNALVAVKTQTSNYIYFNTVSGLAYGNTYKWTVEVEYNNGSSIQFGPASSNTCTITFNPPQTTLSCGNTYTSSTAYSAITALSGATGYRFSFYDAGTMALVASKAQTSNYIYFNQVVGLIFNKNYKWTVEVQYNNGAGLVYGPASSNTCTMTWGAPAPKIIGDTHNESARLSQQIIDDYKPLIVNVFPNPASDKIYIESSESLKDVTIYNISGELVLKPETLNEINLGNLKSGLYMITIRTENNTTHSKIIKE